MNITNEKILALSWKEPFASLMLQGKIETRKRKTDYRGLVLICVSKKGYELNELFRVCGFDQYQRVIENMSHYMHPGCAIAIGRLAHCRKMTKADEDICFVRYSEELWCWVFTDVQPIEPFEWHGTQGWKEVDEATKAKIKILQNA